MSKVISIANQKGGVGKTTSSINLGSELARLGRRVLVVDFDPQGSASSGLGISLHPEGKDAYDMFFGRVPLSEIIVSSCVEGLDVAPASHDLVSIELELGKTAGRELILRSQLNLLRTRYDYVIIDCPPSSGLLSLNALGASDYICIPLQAEYYALEGLSALMNTFNFVQKTFNPQLAVLGVFLTMYDGRTNLASQVEREASDFFGDLMFTSKIPRNIKLSEAPSHGVPICIYDGASAGAKAYASLALEVDARCFGNEFGREVANG